MTRAQLLERLDAAWRSLLESYSGLSEAQLLEPGVIGSWSIKDVISHVTTWEEECLKHLPDILAGTKPPRYSVTYGGIDAFNALMTERNAGLTLSDILKRRDEVHRQVVSAVQHAPDEQIARETPFRRRIRLDTYGHYRVHAGAIRRWRERNAVNGR